MGDPLRAARQRLIAAALRAPPLEPANCQVLPVTISAKRCDSCKVLLRVPSEEEALQEHVRRAHELASSSVDGYEEAMREECARLVAERPTYWGQLWPGGTAMGALLLERPELVSSRRVLEIGAGLGIGAVCAALAGAASVLATDHEDQSLRFTAHNAAENGVGERVRTARLDWTEPTAEDLLRERFDVVVAADVLYENDTPAHVARLMRELVRPRGLALFSDGRDRPYLDRHTRQLLDALTAGGEFEVVHSEELDVAVDEGGAVKREMRVVALERRHVFPMRQ